MEDHTDWVRSVAAVDDGCSCLSASYDGTIKLWDFKTGACLKTMVGHSSDVFCLRLTDASKFLSSSGDRTIKLWDFNTGRCLKTMENHTSIVFCIAVVGPDKFLSSS